MFEGTTILCVRRDGKVAMAGDGQVTMGNTILKQNARKTRKMYEDKILAGFSGATADAFTLFEKFEGKIQSYRGNITRAAVELAKAAHLRRPLLWPSTKTRSLTLGA
jgi:ATP-dependent HslUV protease subunit HslV